MYSLIKIKIQQQKISMVYGVMFLIASSLLTSCFKRTIRLSNTSRIENKAGAMKADIIVAQDGTGDYMTIQEAVNAAPDNRRSYYYIYVKKGNYKEIVTIPKNKMYIYLIGESAEITILTYDNYAARLKSDGTKYGTSGSASFFVHGDHFVAENITFENKAGVDAGQALAINIGAAQSAFRNCRFLGHQDTWYAGNGTFQYLKDCYIEGSVDYIFGGSTAFFENCRLESTRNGYLTAASTPEGQAYGYVFYECTLSARPEVSESSVYLGRPWRPNANVVYIECNMAKHIQKVGWHNWGNAENEKTAFYAEYKSTGEGGFPYQRVWWSKQLTDEEASNFSYTKVIAGKHPNFVDEKISVK